VFSFLEFFAGGGMARAGLGVRWTCLFANDFDPRKACSYARNWGADHLHVGDVAAVPLEILPPHADLAWASFPCQDLSLAGAQRGLEGGRSSAFWPFWDLMRALGEQAPALVMLENVAGALTSRAGQDFAVIGEALATAGYRYGALMADAIHFTPQSRPRLFILAIRRDLQIPSDLAAAGPDPIWHTHVRPRLAGDSWIWWKLPAPPLRTARLQDLVEDDLVEDDPADAPWHSREQTCRLIELMAPLHRDRVRQAQASGIRQVGAVYRRTRVEAGVRRQRAEVRFDGAAGCLRTPGGGSSRQTLLFVKGESIRSRLLSAREAARLMGLPDSYQLPDRYNEAYRLLGDGVAVPVVRFLARHLLEPLLLVNRVLIANRDA
jgi:DNA (cytosine-5)-methyltransferase 1